LTSKNKEEPFDWTRADELIVRLTSLSIKWNRMLDSHPEWRADADTAEESRDEEYFKSPYPYFC
jgi:hypothetical protein